MTTLQEEWEEAKRAARACNVPLQLTMAGDKLAAALDLAEVALATLEQERDVWRALNEKG